MGDMNDTIINDDHFYGMKPGHRAILVEGEKTAQFKAGQLLFQEGEPANQFYLIQNGKIALAHNCFSVQVQHAAPAIRRP